MPLQEPRLAELECATATFLRRHWIESENGVPPEWVIWSQFLYGSVPNYKQGGCYALFVGDSLVYIGKGSSRGGGTYIDHGISRRLMAHVYSSAKTVDCRQLRLKEPWLDVTSLYTIGLTDRDYLAPALEGFLIRTLLPARNMCV